MPDSSPQIIPAVLDVCRRLYEHGFVTATDGNVSARLANGNFLTTRSAVNKGMVTEADLLEVDSSGQVVGSDLRPSTELGMHLFVYSRRPDVHAVVHAHPIHATGFATARQSLSSCLFPEVIVGMGAIPLAEYATPSTGEVAHSLAPYVESADAILLANHGVVTFGKDPLDAYFKMEKVEHAAHITFVARLLGGEHRLSAGDIEKLRALGPQTYGKDFSGKPACETGPERREAENVPDSDDEILRIVRTMLGR